jgi:hypothetical protein
VVIASGCAACRKSSEPSSCGDVSGLAPEDARARTSLAYVEPAQDTSRHCASCQQYVAAQAEGGCGACKVLRGAIHPSGTCKVFAPKSA